jgi:prepilin-type N-terminal cleavage/methylation domain-containing protein
MPANATDTSLPSACVTRAQAHEHGHRSNDGFTLIELIVAMTIMSLLIGLAIPRFVSMRRTSTYKAGVTAATSYQQAIDQFRLDHNNRVPVIGSVDWPSGSDTARRGGPINQYNKPYLRSGVPEAVLDGSSDLQDDTNNVTMTDMLRTRIVYAPGPGSPPTTYTLRVEKYDDSTWSLYCTLGNSATTTGNC